MPDQPFLVSPFVSVIQFLWVRMVSAHCFSVDAWQMIVMSIPTFFPCSRSIKPNTGRCRVSQKKCVSIRSVGKSFLLGLKTLIPSCCPCYPCGWIIVACLVSVLCDRVHANLSVAGSLPTRPRRGNTRTRPTARSMLKSSQVSSSKNQVGRHLSPLVLPPLCFPCSICCVWSSAIIKEKLNHCHDPNP